MYFPNDIWNIIKTNIFTKLYQYCDGSIIAYDSRDQDTYFRILEQDDIMAYEQYATIMLHDDEPAYIPRHLEFQDIEEIDDWIHGIPLYDLTHE